MPPHSPLTERQRKRLAQAVYRIALRRLAAGDEKFRLELEARLAEQEKTA